MMIGAVDTLSFYVWSNIAVITLLIFFPYIMRFIILSLARFYIFIIPEPRKYVWEDEPMPKPWDRRKMLNRFQQFLAIAFFPGSMIRITFLYGYLTIKGWKLTVAYNPKMEIGSNSLFAERRRQGFYLIMSQGKHRFTLRDAISITILCYIPMLLSILMFTSYAGNMRFIDYIFNRDFVFWRLHFPIHVVNRVIYVYFALALLIGGAAVPEETAVILYHLLANYPHFIISCILALIGSILISYLDVPGPFSANYLAMSTLQVFCTILFVKVMLDDRELQLFEEDRFKFDDEIYDIAIF